MKKIFSILAIAAMFIVAPVKSQTLVRLASGAAGDTLHASYTKYSSAVNVNFSNTQGLSFQFAVDSISGAPAGSFIVQHSVDGVHWNVYAGDTVSYTNAGWNTRGANGSGDTATNQSKVLNFYPFYGAYARVKTTTTSATQKSKYWIMLKSSNSKY